MRSPVRPLLMLVLFLLARPAAGQEGGSVSGTIIDAATSLPLADASVALEGRGGERSRTARTDAAGRYAFAGVAAGAYRLRVQRIGYRSTTVDVELRGGVDPTVSVGLTVQPVALPPVHASAAPAGTRAESYARTAEPARLGEYRVAAERQRQRLHASSDVRSITHADVQEGITLGETDLFRALQRMPGVAAGDDYTAELWTRGARWDQTRVFFDGLPLFNPVHAVGAFAGVNADAVGAAFLHPGVQPASLGGAAAGALDVRSRRGGSGGTLAGVGELSLVSARLALDGEAAEGRDAWMIAGRRTYLDWLTRAVQSFVEEDVYTPYSFYDVAARYDRRLGGGRALEASGLVSRDRLAGMLPDVVDEGSGSWGSEAGRATLRTPLGGLEAAHTLGFSRFRSRLRPNPADTSETYSAPDILPSSNRVTHAELSGGLGPRAVGTAPAAWSAGYALVAERVRFRGFVVSRDDGPPAPGEEAFVLEDALEWVALWGERRWRPREGLTLEGGMRVEAGPSVRNGGAVRLAPRLAARVQVDPQLSLSAGVGRSFQYLQTVAPAGVPAVREHPSEYVYALAGGDVPAARADIATLGAERWLGGQWLGSATAYVRRTTGMAVQDPTPGPLVDRPLFVAGEGDARGLELSVRRLAGRWTASAGYALSRSEITAKGLTFSAPEEQRHTFDATAYLRAGRGVQLGAAYTAASGVPYTRRFDRDYLCDAGGCRPDGPPSAEEPGGQRAPDYRSLDLLAEWGGHVRGARVSGYLQLRNTLGSDNRGRYTGTTPCEVLGTSACGPGRPTGYDDFSPGLPRLPVIGLRLSF
ncbi:MAG TPA: TonB-dependent receptor [Longimicrobium sp.]